MNTLIFHGLSMLAVALILVVPVSAKGPTVKLTLSGPGLSHSVDLTDGHAIDANVWAGNFVRWQEKSASEPRVELPRYRVQFHVLPPHSEVKMMYVVYYVWDPATEEALVYLPGPGEDWYSLNISTIYRSGQNGKWHHASDEWGDAIRSALP